MATIKEIAQLAAVSPTTVSRVLTQDPSLNVTPATRLRVEQIARELGYSVRRTHAVSRPKHTVGLIKGYTDSENLATTHFNALARSVEDTLAAHNYRRVIFSPDALPDQPLDGVIALGQYSSAQIASLARLSENLLFLHTSPDPLRFDSICLDAHHLAHSAVSFLRQLGHRRIAYIGASDVIGGMRMPDLFYQSMRQALLDEDPQGNQWMYITDYSPTAAYTITGALLRENPPSLRPTAIVYVTDSMAVGGYRAVRECCLRVGEDVSILSIDNAPTSSHLLPPLSSFHLDVDFIARTAVAMLSDRLEQRRQQSITVQIPLRLVRRKSCLAPAPY